MRGCGASDGVFVEVHDAIEVRGRKRRRKRERLRSSEGIRVNETVDEKESSNDGRESVWIVREP